MNYEYYKYKLLDNDFDKFLKENIKKYDYCEKNTFNLDKKKQVKIYKKNKVHSWAKLGSYIMFVDADEINHKELDLLVNYYLSLSNVDVSNDVGYLNVFNIYIILKVKKMNDDLLKFIKYGATTPNIIGMKYWGKLQVPIVFDSYSNEVLVGTYPNYFYGKMIMYKNALEDIKSFFERYYLDNNLNMEDLKPIICNKNRKFREGLYPLSRIYTKFSKASQKKYYSFIETLILDCFAISTVMIIITKFKNLFFIILSFIIGLALFYKNIKLKKERILKYNEIKLELDNCNYLDFFDNYLTSNNYQKLDDNQYKLNNVVFCFANKGTQIEDFDKNYNYYVILDDENTKLLARINSLNNVLVFRYNNGFLKIVKGKNYKLLKYFFKIINDTYNI